MSTIIDGKAIADKLTKSVAEEINLIKKPILDLFRD